MRKLNASYIRGFYDADGSVCLNNRGRGQVALVNTDYDLLLRIAAWLKVRDYNYSITKVKYDGRWHFKTSKQIYRLDIHEFRSIEKFFKEVGTCMQSRWDTWLKIKEAKRYPPLK